MSGGASDGFLEFGMRASALAMSVVGVALLGSTPAAAQDRPAQDLPAMVGGRPVPALLGVWRSRGYGYVVRMAADGPTLFHVAGNFCYWDPRQERDPDNLFKFYRSAGPTRSRSTAIAGRPRTSSTGCRTCPRLAPIHAMVAAAHRRPGGGDLRRPLSRRFELRGIDWRARTAAAARAIDEKSDDAALFETLRTMLAGIEDPHVELRAEVAGEPRSFDPGNGLTLTRIRARIRRRAVG